jgi:hypothetical protein
MTEESARINKPVRAVRDHLKHPLAKHFVSDESLSNQLISVAELANDSGEH